MKQEVMFVFAPEEIGALITWEETGDGRYEVDFFDRVTGFTGSSSPTAAQGNWSYQDAEAQQNIQSLINAVHQWGTKEDWCEFLSWEDGAVDVFTFEWDGKTYEGYDDEYKTLTRVF